MKKMHFGSCKILLEPFFPGEVIQPSGAWVADKNQEIDMFKKALFITAALAPFMMSGYALAQSAQPNIDGVDPACLISAADGSRQVDMKKCPDGKAMNAGQSTTTNDVVKTDSTTPAPTPLIVPKESMTGAKIMSASDIIGKTVYSRTNENIGEVNDVILSGNGVQAVILGVGGFLGIGEKDVAVSMNSIEAADNGAKLVVDATKDQLTGAPAYDRKARQYITQ
jgi:sporulation protein YlmC with PRC-barrel domain